MARAAESDWNGVVDFAFSLDYAISHLTVVDDMGSSDRALFRNVSERQRRISTRPT